MYKFENYLSSPLVEDMFQNWKNTFNLKHFQIIANNKLCKNGSEENIISCTSIVESGPSWNPD